MLIQLRREYKHERVNTSKEEHKITMIIQGIGRETIEGIVMITTQKNSAKATIVVFKDE